VDKDEVEDRRLPLILYTHRSSPPSQPSPRPASPPQLLTASARRRNYKTCRRPPFPSPLPNFSSIRNPSLPRSLSPPPLGASPSPDADTGVIAILSLPILCKESGRNVLNRPRRGHLLQGRQPSIPANPTSIRLAVKPGMFLVSPSTL
jgi:hypothetical protein